MEGEKKVDRLWELGAIAVSGDSGTSSKWLPTHGELLRGLPVILWPDSDEPGEKYIANAAAAIRAVDPGADLRVVHPFGLPDGAKGRDVCDWTGNADDLAELVARTARPYAPMAEPLGEAINTQSPPAPFASIINPADWEGLTEDTLAVEFAAEHQASLRYVDKWGKWLQWHGSKWRPDETRDVFTLSRAICRSAAVGVKLKSVKAALGKAKTVAAAEQLARCDDQLKATVDQWDVDTSALNADGDHVNLKFADIKMRPTRPDDYMTKSTACKPADGEPVMFLAFLDRIMGDNKEMIPYLRRVFGYCCTGYTKEHTMFFFYGTGANGKSVLLSTISGILGNYHTTAPIETFTEQHGSSSHPTELAGLMGARLVTAIETEEGRRWNESRIKVLTGGDKISARFMRQDFFEFIPQFKLIVAGNRKPSLRTVDEAMRRRVQMVPFNVTIPPEERDLDLAEILKAEWPQILTWMIKGCYEWQEIGLKPPAAVIDATNAYFEAEDSISSWIEDRCELKPRNWEASGLLFASWKSWAEAAGEPVGSQKAFTQKLAATGLIPKIQGHANKRGFLGICLLENGQTNGDKQKLRAHANAFPLIGRL